MAGNNDDGAGNPPAHRDHFDYLSSTFVGHFNNIPEMLNAEQKPRPLDGDQYFDDQDTDQSNTCARLAVEFYSQQPGNSPISLLRAKDSHKFYLDDGTVYYHVNFKAAVLIDHPARREPPAYTFFAEVTGEMDDPENVTMVVLFRTKEERQTRDNCSYCTGLRHPKQGGFVGHQPEDEDDSDEDSDSDNE